MMQMIFDDKELDLVIHIKLRAVDISYNFTVSFKISRVFLGWKLHSRVCREEFDFKGR